MEIQIASEPIAGALTSTGAADGPGRDAPARTIAVLATYDGGRLGEAAASLGDRAGGALRAAGLRAFGEGSPGAGRTVATVVPLGSTDVVLVDLGPRAAVRLEDVRRAAALAMRASFQDAGAGLAGAPTTLHCEALGREAGLAEAQCLSAVVEGFLLAEDAMAREVGGGPAAGRGPDLAPGSRLLYLHGSASALPTGLRRGRKLALAAVRARAYGARAGAGADVPRASADQSHASEDPTRASADPPRTSLEEWRPPADGGIDWRPLAGGSGAAGTAGDAVVWTAVVRGEGRRRPVLCVLARGRFGEGEPSLAAPAALVGALPSIAESRLPLDVRGVILLHAGRGERAGSAAAMAAASWLREGSGEGGGDGALGLLHVASDVPGAMEALGDEMAVLMASDQRLGETVQRAGVVAGEKLWPLPVDEAYGEGEGVDDAPADERTRPGPGALAIRAGMRAARLAEDMPWAHLDVRAAALQRRAYHPSRPGAANGFGARTLVLAAERLAPPPDEA